MKTDITQDVVNDLWPLCRSGDASAGSRALVDAYLAQDAAFAATLRESETMSNLVPPVRLSPDGELRLLQDIQHRARTKLLILAGAIAVSAVLALVSLGAAIYVVALRAGS